MKTTSDYYVRKQRHAKSPKWVVIENCRDAITRELVMASLVCICTKRHKAIAVSRALTKGGFVVNGNA